MKSKLSLVTLTLTLAIVFTGSAFANEPHDKAQPARILKAALNLDDEQVMALRDLIEGRAAETQAIHVEIQLLQTQLEELVKSAEPDPAEVGGLVLDIRVLKQEVGEGHGAYQQSFRDILDPMQQERLGHIHRIAVAASAAEVLHKLKLF